MEKKLNFNPNLSDKCYYSDSEKNVSSKYESELIKYNNNKRANSYGASDYFLKEEFK